VCTVASLARLSRGLRWHVSQKNRNPQSLLLHFLHLLLHLRNLYYFAVVHLCHFSFFNSAITQGRNAALTNRPSRHSTAGGADHTPRLTINAALTNRPSRHSTAGDADHTPRLTTHPGRKVAGEGGTTGSTAPNREGRVGPGTPATRRLAAQPGWTVAEEGGAAGGVTPK